MRADEAFLPSDAVMMRLSALGDVTLTTGVLRWWHAKRGWKFTVITRQAYAGLFEHHPAVAQVVGLTPHDLDHWMRVSHQLSVELGNRMLVDLHGSGRSMTLAALWSAGHYRRYPKLGVARRLYRLLRLPWAGNRLLHLNVPQRYALALDRQAPATEDVRPQVFLQEHEVTQARDFLASRGLDPTRPIVALHPYATYPQKAWPAERWQELAALLHAQGRQWLVVGANPQPFLADMAGGLDLTNACDVRGTCAMLACCGALVSGDSGPMHLGTAVGTPVVALFGPTTRHWGFFPSGRQDIVLERQLSCRPCSLHGARPCGRGLSCLLGIEARQVLEQVDSLLSTADL